MLVNDLKRKTKIWAELIHWMRNGNVWWCPGGQLLLNNFELLECMKYQKKKEDVSVHRWIFFNASTFKANNYEKKNHLYYCIQ